MDITFATIKNLYIDKFIKSMEEDYDCWVIARGVVYESNHYKNIQFGLSPLPIVWVDGCPEYIIPSYFEYNIFSHKSRRFYKAKRKLIKHLENKESQSYLNNLMKSL